jgi:hypothetical protein
MSILKRGEEDCGDHVSFRLDRGRSGVDRAGLRSLALASLRGEGVEYGVRRMFLEGNFVDWWKVSSVADTSWCCGRELCKLYYRALIGRGFPWSDQLG